MTPLLNFSRHRGMNFPSTFTDFSGGSPARNLRKLERHKMKINQPASWNVLLRASKEHRQYSIVLLILDLQWVPGLQFPFIFDIVFLKWSIFLAILGSRGLGGESKVSVCDETSVHIWKQRWGYKDTNKESASIAVTYINLALTYTAINSSHPNVVILTFLR